MFQKAIDQVIYNVKLSKAWLLAEKQTRVLLLIGLGNLFWSVTFLPILELSFSQEVFFGTVLTFLGVIQLLFLYGSNIKLRLLLTFLSTIFNGTVLFLILAKGIYSPAIPTQTVLAFASAYIFVTTRELRVNEHEKEESRGNLSDSRLN
jgi:hypothetical protein